MNKILDIVLNTLMTILQIIVLYNYAIKGIEPNMFILYCFISFLIAKSMNNEKSNKSR